MKPGAIVVERVSRTFRVYPEQSRTLKELIVTRGRAKPREVVALQDVSFRVEPGEAVGLIGRNGSGKTTLLRLIAGIMKPTGGRVDAGGRVGSLLELGAGFHPEFTGEQNVYLNGSILGLKRREIREHIDEIFAFAELEPFRSYAVRTYSSGMYMRLGFAVAAHLQADVLLLDEVFAVGDEEFQRKCFGKIAEYKRRGGTIVFVSHDAGAVERLCERAVLLRHGRVELDGTAREAIKRYHKLLADERDPAERAAGLHEYGSGEARIAEARLVGPEGEERVQFLSGEPLAVELRVTAERALPSPRLSVELRDDAGLVLASETQDLGELGWDGPGDWRFRFDVERLPLGEGWFHVRLELSDADGMHLYHWLDDALKFAVIAPQGGRGLVRLDGRFSGEEVAPPAQMVRR
jgi:ABC-2 type transport system ATP-binding protein